MALSNTILLPKPCFFPHVARDEQDDLFFLEVNFTLSSGGRTCFNVTVIDDDEFEYRESYYFYLHLNNGTYHVYNYDRTYISIIDNDGKWYNIAK